jgi:ParB/RepB/Spo0J family partition protein
MGEVREVPWRRVRPMAGQPREYFDKAALEELARSIAAVGQVVPAQVTPLPPGGPHDWELLDGQRRWHAAAMAGLETLRAEVVDEPDEERRYLRSVVANLARAPHHPLEIAVACDRLRRGRTLAEVAAMLGKSVGYVSQHLSLLGLCDEAKRRLHPRTPKAERLPYSAALLLTGMDPADQARALAAMRASGLTPLRAARKVAEERAAAAPARPKEPSKMGRNLGCALRRAILAVEEYPAETAAARLRRLPEHEMAQVREQLARLCRGVESILGELESAARKGA